MKKFFLILVSLVLTLSLFLTGCGEKEEDRADVLKETLESTYKDLTSTFSGETGQYDLVAEYLKSWANKKEIEIAYTHENYMIMVNPATEGLEDVETIVLQCAIETNNFGNSLQALAISLTSLLGPEIHGEIKLIITECRDGEFLGAAAIEAEQCASDHFINIQHSDDVQLFTAGAHEQTAVMTSELSMTEPSYPHAYAITMTIAGYHDPFDFDGRYPNPVEIVGNLLANAKSSGELFQLASFECEGSPGYTPTTATAIVVIDSNDVESFTKKFNSSYRNMKERFEKLEDNFVYTFTETALPAQVMTGTSSDNIISLMYTLKTGIYLQDEDTGEVISASNISHVTTVDNKFSLSMIFRSIDTAVLQEMSDVFLTTSGLCDITYTPSESHVTWSSDKKKELAAFFTDALGSQDSIFTSTLESNEADILSAKCPLNMVSYRFNIHHAEAASMNILHFQESLIPEDVLAEAEAAAEESAE